MTDGTGSTTYNAYNQYDEPTSITNGTGHNVQYGYDAYGNETSITYPNGKQVLQQFNADEQLSTVTDWLANKTTFAYTPDSLPQSTSYPSASSDVDSYTYNNGDQLNSITMAQGTSALASLFYTPDATGQPTLITQTGLPGAASTSYGYAPTETLASAGGNTYTYYDSQPLQPPAQLEATTLAYNANGYLQNITNASKTLPVQYNADAQRALGASPQLTGEATTTMPRGGWCKRARTAA